jgi:uncharacterized membrane protein YfcA
VVETLILLAAVAGGIVASVAGFGIGSLVTPVLAWQLDAKLAVAAVSIPHVIGTAVRFWRLGGHVDRRVLANFGVMSAGGGLLGALLQERATTPALLILFGGLLLFSSAAELTGFGRRMQFGGALAWMAGALSGFLGGLVGNQGGIRSAALLGVELPKHAFVTTATAVALMVDAARVPVYVWSMGDAMARLSVWIVIATIGVVVGTLIGLRLLARIPEYLFRRVVAVVLAVLGAAMVGRALVGTRGL